MVKAESTKWLVMARRGRKEKGVIELPQVEISQNPEKLLLEMDFHHHVHQPPKQGIPPTVAGVDEGYGHMHKIVLQGMLAAGVLNSKGVKRLFYGACVYLNLSPEERTTMAYIQKIVHEINEKTIPHDFCIKSVTCEMTGKKYYMFLITVEKAILKLQTFFSEFEVELFNMSLHGIMKSNTFSVPIFQMINYALNTRMRGKVDDAENFINKLVKMKYFLKMEIPGRSEVEISLGFRGLREFEPILREMYPGALVCCFLCRSTLLHGYACPICKLIVHRGCYEKYMKTRHNGCPGCRALFWGNKKKLLLRTRDLDSVTIPVEPEESQERAVSDNGSDADAEPRLDEEEMQSIFDILRSPAPPSSPEPEVVDLEGQEAQALEQLLSEPVAGPSRLANVPGGIPNEFPGRAAVGNYSDSDSEDEANEAGGQDFLTPLDLSIRKPAN